MQDVLILGTGKMARNIGLFFLRNGCSVSWISRDPDRATSFAIKIKKDIRRLALIIDKSADNFNTHVCDITKIPQKKYELIMESINEDLNQKQNIIHQIDYLLKPGTILTSNSSSLLPCQIHRSAIGLHFFYPIELTNLVEVITYDQIDTKKTTIVIDKLKSWGIIPILQNEQNAFAVNRLLLPMQAEAFHLLHEGYSADLINDCSKSDLLSVGQLELMDSIGLDVLLPAIKNYVSRMLVEDLNNYDVLIEGLNMLIKNDKLGKKNKNGIMIGDPLPWQANDQIPGQVGQLSNKFSNIFKHTCQEFIKNNQIEKKDLDTVIKFLFT